jgi:alkanesulfonate monooxygenase SsuD/methylene tetrahydromethanopterin reductase-like flavin-dependent oxidoreductase (luciferase family)
MEQLQVCRLLWSEAPASFRGESVSFEKIYAYPRPVQPGGVPIWLGLSPSDRNIERMAQFADGWIPMEQDPHKLAPVIARLRGEVAARGRDPRAFTVRVVPRFVFRADHTPDLEATLAGVPALVQAGASMVELFPAAFCRGPEDFEAFERSHARRKAPGGLAKRQVHGPVPPAAWMTRAGHRTTSCSFGTRRRMMSMASAGIILSTTSSAPAMKSAGWVMLASA